MRQALPILILAAVLMTAMAQGTLGTINALSGKLQTITQVERP